MKIIKTLMLLAFLAVAHMTFSQSEFLYGVTNGTTTGSPDGFGSIFRLHTADSVVTQLYAFHGTDGSALNSGVIFASDGFLYGTARYGGLADKGTIFKIKPDGTGFQKIHDFDGIDGEDASGGLVEGTDGLLYGTTMSGGTYGVGVVYKIDKAGTGFQKLIDLDFTTTGYSPRARPTIVLDDLYITNAQGGANDTGTILRVAHDGTFVKLIDFDGADKGSYPNGALILGSDNFLYGTASAGGANDAGTLFRLIPDGTGFQKLFDFSNENGASPLATLVESSSGALFGTTFGGGGAVVFGQGVFYYGTVFKINKDGSDFTEVHDFGAPGDGAFPDGSLVENNGVLFGITLMGGSNQSGTIYKINVDGSAYSKIYDFDNTLGSNPRYVLTPARTVQEIPKIEFATSGLQRAEGSGSYQVDLRLSASISTEQKVKVYVQNGVGVLYGVHHFPDYTTHPRIHRDTLYLAIPANASVVSFTVVPLRDHKRERDEHITFTIAEVGGGLEKGAQTSFRFTILDNRCHPHFKVYPNPMHNVVSLIGEEGDEDEILTVALWSPYGELLLSDEGTLDQLNLKLRTILHDRRSGVYLLRLLIDEEETLLRIQKR
jgi:uncharacterized repeat protein (TIGR03803 family)